jgi:hypothetical protein
VLRHKAIQVGSIVSNRAATAFAKTMKWNADAACLTVLSQTVDTNSEYPSRSVLIDQLVRRVSVLHIRQLTLRLHRSDELFAPTVSMNLPDLGEEVQDPLEG